MTIPMFHSLWTIAVLAIFIGIIFWAYSKHRRVDFDEAANLPLEEDQPLATNVPKSRSNSEQKAEQQ